MSMRELANHIIAVAENNDLTITNLQLQKILYFTLRNSKNLIDMDLIEKTYNEPFLVWRYGPVVKSQYERFNSYGSNPITEHFEENMKYRPLNDLIIRFLNVHVFRMVDASHSHSFWKENESKIILGRSNVEYPLDEVLR